MDCTNGVANEFEGVLGRFERKKFFQGCQFFDFFCISGVTDFLKNDQLLFWEIPAWNLLWTAQMVLLTNFKAFKVVSSEKNFFQKLEIFWLFFAYPGSQISWKMTNYFFERYWPEICRGLHKWCYERILTRFRLFRAKKNFFWESEIFLLFLHIRGHRFLEKWLTTFLRNTGLKFVVDCTNGVANEF